MGGREGGEAGAVARGAEKEKKKNDFFCLCCGAAASLKQYFFLFSSGTVQQCGQCEQCGRCSEVRTQVQAKAPPRVFLLFVSRGGDQSEQWGWAGGRLLVEILGNYGAQSCSGGNDGA